ncbi:ester cyclase, partial [Arthrobacter deserti]|nr:ester cyclase [Arthrobacter deserti]
YVRVSKASGSEAGLAELQQEILAVREGFPDLTTTIDNFVTDGDTAAIFWTTKGTHTRPFLGVPPTNRPVETRGSNILTLRGGRIARETVTWDGSELLCSLGIRPLGDAAAA